MSGCWTDHASLRGDRRCQARPWPAAATSVAAACLLKPQESQVVDPQQALPVQRNGGGAWCGVG